MNKNLEDVPNFKAPVIKIGCYWVKIDNRVEQSPKIDTCTLC